MKKSLVLMTSICLLSIAYLKANTVTPVSVAHHYIAEEWSKAKDGIWEGTMDNKTYWYKLDKNAKLWWSTNGKKWAAVENGMWADKEGKWLKIGDGKLWWSADKGANWAEVPEWKWEGPKGQWYKFDKDWSLWVTKA